MTPRLKSVLFPRHSSFAKTGGSVEAFFIPIYNTIYRFFKLALEIGIFHSIFSEMFRLLDARLLIAFLLGTAIIPVHDAHAQKNRTHSAVSSDFVDNTQMGTASWYGGRDIGRLTASGERYHRMDITAAHRRLPFNTLVLVTNLKNGKAVVVRINDRGPYAKGRIIDLSFEAAKSIGLLECGIAKVCLEILDPAEIQEFISAS